MKHNRTLAVAPCLGLLAAPAFARDDLALYAYTSAKDAVPNAQNRGFNATAAGYAWQQAGFLNESGRPFVVNRDGNIVDGDTVVGKAIRAGADGRTLIGWLNETTNTAVIDLQHGKAQEAFSLYKGGKGGIFQIMAHGGRVQVSRSGSSFLSDGGLIYLDGNKMYGGFENGTGGAVDGRRVAPYAPITGIADSKIDLRLYSCFSSAEPGGNAKSVTTSAQDIKGVQSVVGSVPVVGSRVDVDFEVVANPDNVPRAQIEKLLNAIVMNGAGAELRGKNSNLPAYRLYANVLRFRSSPQGGGVYDFYDRTLNNLQSGRIKLKWTMTYAADTELRSGLFNRDFPWVIARSETDYAGRLEFEWPDSGRVGSTVDALITGDAGDDSADYEALHLGLLGDIDELPPSPITDLRLQSSVMSLTPMDGFTDTVAGTWRLALAADAVPETIQLYRLTEAGWALLPGPILFETDGSGPVARYDFAPSALDDTYGFTIAAFGIPAPGAAMPLALCLLARRSRRP